MYVHQFSVHTCLSKLLEQKPQRTVPLLIFHLKVIRLKLHRLNFFPLCSSTMSAGLFLYLVWWLEITRKSTCNKTFVPISHPTSFRRLTNRVSDNVIILRYFISVHGLKKRPCHLVALRETKEHIVNKACVAIMITGRLNFLGKLFFVHNTQPVAMKTEIVSPNMAFQLMKLRHCILSCFGHMQKYL